MNSLLLVIAALLQPAKGVDVVTDTVYRDAPIRAARVDIVGTGFNGTDPTGPAICFQSRAVDGFVLGAGDPFRATGSRLDRLRIVREGNGGTAIKFVATSASERPGEIVLRDILVCGMTDLRGGPQKHNWETALLIDGGALNESGAAGVRRIRIDHFRAASCLGESIVLRNVTHVVATDVQIDRGTSPRAVPQITIENSRHVFIYGLNIFGEIHIRACENVVIDGYAQAVYVDARCKGVKLSGVFPRMVSAGKTFERVSEFTRW